MLLRTIEIKLTEIKKRNSLRIHHFQGLTNWQHISPINIRRNASFLVFK
ncbi:hypothetical protein AQPE_1368 [Aquipluma nitroreducens]|uniref:Uncharacterized protein n=1 Tax=Aquipluma nitroreducens TaxID=2010828 RepID=A0A5K7S703_9BACT|nr:hypothetical protein AQPE_1368 [Aquipluma nitroreducens]